MTSVPRTALTEIQTKTLGRLAAHEVNYRRKLDLYRQCAEKRLLRIKRSERTLRRSVVEYHAQLKHHIDATAKSSDDEFASTSRAARDTVWMRVKRDAYTPLLPPPSTGSQEQEVRDIKSGVSESDYGHFNPNNLTSALSGSRYNVTSGGRWLQRKPPVETPSSKEQRLNELTLAMTKRLVPLNVVFSESGHKSGQWCQTAAPRLDNGDVGRLTRPRLRSTSEGETDAASSGQATQDGEDEHPLDKCISFLELIRLRQLCGLSKYPKLLTAITKKIEKETKKATKANRPPLPVATSSECRRAAVKTESVRTLLTGTATRTPCDATGETSPRSKGAPMSITGMLAHCRSSPRHGSDVISGCVERATDALITGRGRIPSHKSSDAVKLPVINEEQKRGHVRSPCDSRCCATKLEKRRKMERRRRFARQEEFAQVRPHLALGVSYAVDGPPMKRGGDTGRSPLPGSTRNSTARTRLSSGSGVSMTSSSLYTDNDGEETTIQMERRLKQQRLQRLEQGNVLTWKESLASVRECHYLNS